MLPAAAASRNLFDIQFHCGLGMLTFTTMVKGVFKLGNYGLKTISGTAQSFVYGLLIPAKE